MTKPKPQNTSIEPYERFRVNALLFEFLPLALGFLGAILGNVKMINAGFITSAFVYFLLCWYLFKAEDYNVLDAIVALLFGMCLSIITLIIPYQLKDMEDKESLFYGGFIAIVIGLIFSLLLLFFKRKDQENWEFEYTMSQKIFSRFVMFLLIYLVLGMHQPFFEKVF